MNEYEREMCNRAALVSNRSREFVDKSAVGYQIDMLEVYLARMREGHNFLGDVQYHLGELKREMEIAEDKAYRAMEEEDRIEQDKKDEEWERQLKAEQQEELAGVR